MTISYTNTCGTPRVATITNTSTRRDSAITTYRYYLNGALFATTIGRNPSPSVQINSLGNNRLTVIATDTSGCIDSAFSTVNITTNAAQLYDQNIALSYVPSFINCIQLSSAPDSFLVSTSSNDTLRRPIFIWGDGTIDSFGTNQPPGTVFNHWFVNTGIFRVRIVQRSATCTDTLYGIVENLRQPTAGLIGPGPGANTGCANHTVTMRNNSSNIGAGTLFTWNWGNGSTSTQSDTQFNSPTSHTYTQRLCNGSVTLTATNSCGSSFTTWNPINISEDDLADFRIDSSNCTPGNPFTFTNLSSDRYCLLPDPKQYYWDWGDGTNTGWINTFGPNTHIYTAQGRRTVMLVTRNNCGQDTIYRSFNVTYFPQPGFYRDTTFGCNSVRIFVDDTSNAINSVRLWNFGNGFTSTSDTVTHFYNTPGIYPLTLSITNRCGTRIARDTVRVFERPYARFNDTAGGCAPLQINPSNFSLSNGPNITYFWDFGNGNTSTNRVSGIINYTIPGNYILKHRITNLCGVDSLLATIRVDTTPVSNVITDTVICAFDTLTFNNSSSNYRYLITNFGDGSALDTQTMNGIFRHVFTSPGNRVAVHRAVANGGCSARDTSIIRVRSNALANFSVNSTQACAPFTFTFSNTSLFSNKFLWYLDGVLQSTTAIMNPVFVATDSTIHRVKLVAVDSTSCFADSIERSFFTARNPIAAIQNNIDSGCGPFIDTMLNSSRFANTYSWQFGNGTSSTLQNPNTVFLPNNVRDTNYVQRLIAINWIGCRDTAFGQRKVFPLPSVRFTVNNNNGCGPLLVQFNNNSIPNDTGSIGIMNFLWSFGNGNTSVSQQVSQSFVSSNIRDTSFRVRLIGYSEHQCEARDSNLITVYPQPFVQFLATDTQGCAPLNVGFTNLSNPRDTGSINIMSFIWRLGDGVVSTTTNSNKTYFASQTRDTNYLVRLVAFTEHGCLDSVAQNIKIFPKPRVRFIQSQDSGCSPLAVQFINTSIPHDTGNIAIMQFNWSFGNNQFSAARDTAISYLERPLLDTNYRVRLIGSSEHGCLDTFFSIIKVHPLPYPFFNANRFSGCGPLTVNFTSTSTLANQHYWNFGNGFNLGLPNISNVFQAANLIDSLYNVQLYAVSNRNCFSSDTFSLPIVVRANPIADFAMSDDSICINQLSLFYNLSQGASRFKWYFGTGDSSVFYNPIYNYPPSVNPLLPTIYSVKVEATNFFNCKDSIRRNIYVFPNVIAQFTADRDSACAPLNVVFTNNSINQNRNYWEFGDGDTSNLLNPLHRYDNYSTQNIIYRAILRVSNQFGCFDYDSLNLVTIPVPFADFTPIRNNICDSGYYDLVNRSINATGYLWNFGDGTPNSTLANPRHLFRHSIYNDTSYTITLTVSNDFGCAETTTKSVFLPVKMTVLFDTLPYRIICQPSDIVMRNRTKNSFYQIWYFGDGGIKTDSQPTHTYTKAGQFGVKLVAFDINSCKDSFVSANIINVLPKPIANFTYNPVGPKVPNAIVTFTSLASPIGLSHAWQYGDGAASNLVNPVHQYIDSGFYTVTLIVNNGTCQDTSIQQIYIEPPLPIIDFTGIDTAGCGPLTVRFSQNTLHATQFRWIFDDGQESALPNPVHTFTIPGYYNITLRAFGPGGSSFLTKDSFVRVYPKPNAQFSASPRRRYLPNALFTMIDGSADAISYRYTISHDSLPFYTYTSTDQSPQFNLTVPGFYSANLVVFNSFGCSDTINRPAHIYVANEGRVLVPTAFTPNGDGINDVFMPILTGVIDTLYSFTVFNRWGGKVYQGRSITDVWDGKYMNEPAMQDAYIWLLSGKFIDGTLFEEKGNVTLLK